jgi:hypothetical protein
LALRDRNFRYGNFDVVLLRYFVEFAASLVDVSTDQPTDGGSSRDTCNSGVGAMADLISHNGAGDSPENSAHHRGRLGAWVITDRHASERLRTRLRIDDTA